LGDDKDGAYNRINRSCGGAAAGPRGGGGGGGGGAPPTRTIITVIRAIFVISQKIRWGFAAKLQPTSSIICKYIKIAASGKDRNTSRKIAALRAKLTDYVAKRIVFGLFFYSFLRILKRPSRSD
jgi:hypothetical protein